MGQGEKKGKWERKEKGIGEKEGKRVEKGINEEGELEEKE